MTQTVTGLQKITAKLTILPHASNHGLPTRACSQVWGVLWVKNHNWSRTTNVHEMIDIVHSRLHFCVLSICHHLSIFFVRWNGAFWGHGMDRGDRCFMNVFGDDLRVIIQVDDRRFEDRWCMLLQFVSLSIKSCFSMVQEFPVVSCHCPLLKYPTVERISQGYTPLASLGPFFFRGKGRALPVWGEHLVFYLNLYFGDKLIRREICC